MNLVKNVYEISEDFMKNSYDVELNYEGIEKFSNEMLSENKIEFPMPPTEDAYKAVVLELVASSINYCYWYGKDTVRPNGSSSSLMYECLANAFFDYVGRDQNKFNTCITRLINLLINHRFPLIEERMYHLSQMRLSAEDYSQKIIDCDDKEDINDLMLELITLFPGFGADLFLKRTFLFFMQMNRRFRWFEGSMKNMPVAADYQVPKMLEYFNCITYTPQLKQKIQNRELISKGSVQECEIRAATVLACKKLCEITGWNIAEVDGYLWLKRKEVTTPFHLTITTDY
jgi:hypothetical protein